jgi:hypothetical protein
MTSPPGKQGINETNLYPTTEVINLISSLAVTDTKLSFQQVKHLGNKQPFVSHSSVVKPEKLSVRKTDCLQINFHLLSRRFMRVMSENNIKLNTFIGMESEV